MEFAEFVSASYPCTEHVKSILRRYANWRASGREGNSGLSLIPGGRAVKWLDSLWSEYEDSRNR